jgi:hypothetical protein
LRSLCSLSFPELSHHSANDVRKTYCIYVNRRISIKNKIKLIHLCSLLTNWKHVWVFG